MKTYKNIKLLLLVFLSAAMLQCESIETDFGFDGSIKGTVMDNNGTPLYGDLNSNNFVVKLLGEGDQTATDIRINGDGSYQNNRLFPKLSKAWIAGPIVFSDTFSIDFGADNDHVMDFTVTPLISPEILSGTANGTSINVDYSIVPNDNNTVSYSEIYCSTVKFPTASIGSKENMYSTTTVSLPDLAGSVEITGLVAGTEYYIRIGSQASSHVVMNYSNQIEITP
jgi:hypothetical protein